MADKPVPLMGRLAIHLQMITMDQLGEAVRLHGRPGEERRLGDLLLDLGFIDCDQLDKLIAAQRRVIEKHQDKQDGAAGTPRPGPSAARPVTPELQASAAGSVAPESTPTATRPAAAPTPAPVSSPARDGALDAVLREAVARNASDVHLRGGQPLLLRVAGALLPFEGATPDPAEVEGMLLGSLDPASRAELDGCGEIDFCYSIEGLGRFRANVYREQRGLDGVFRYIPPTAPSLDALGLPPSVAKLTTFHQGLVLVTGPTGCGKTSTLAALVDLINEERRDHILTIEDPIEYLHTSKRCLVNQRSVKRHTESFARALRAALREDPDVIMIGELRDLETISLALTAAETGHLVLATMHTDSTLRTLNRIVGAFPADQQEQVRTLLSEALRAVVSQRLLTRADGKGRAPALETLIVTKAVANLIRENKVFQIQSILQTGQRQGMCLLDHSIDKLLEAGTISEQEALRYRSAPAPRAA